MENTNNTQPKENNKLLIIIATAAIVVFVALFVVLGLFVFNWFGGSKTTQNASTNNQAPTIVIKDSKGSDSDTKKLKINIRDVKFGTSLKKVKKYEKARKDTLDNPSEASTKDGYTYLTYMYTPNMAKFFGVKPAESKTGALLQYVFKDKKVFDIRIQFGDISKKDRAKIKKDLVKKYGKPTYSIKYSNGSTRDNWKTSAKSVDKQTILSLNYSPNSGTIVDYESFGR